MRKLIVIFIISFINLPVLSQSISQHIENAQRRKLNNDYEGQIKEWDEVIKIDSNDCAWPYYMRAIAKSSIDKYGAIADYTLALKKNKNCQIEFNKSGDTYEVSAMPDSNFLYLKRAELKSEVKDYIGAISDYDLIIKLNNTSEDAYFNRGKTKSLLKDFHGAIEDFNITIKLNPDFIIAFRHRAHAKFDLKDYEGAIKDYSKKIELYDNNNGEDYFNRGLSKLILSQKESACLDFSKAGENGFTQAYEMIKEYCN